MRCFDSLTEIDEYTSLCSNLKILLDLSSLQPGQVIWYTTLLQRWFGILYFREGTAVFSFRVVKITGTRVITFKRLLNGSLTDFRPQQFINSFSDDGFVELEWILVCSPYLLCLLNTSMEVIPCRCGIIDAVNAALNHVAFETNRCKGFEGKD